ncbi:hypothetical protein IID21_00525 [Patescibacteria group bacterium]|nr:hypothetical protein [Patescibacteria group bacterium]
MERRFDIYAAQNVDDGDRVFAAFETEGSETIVAKTESELKQALVELIDSRKDSLRFNRAKQDVGGDITIIKGDDVYLVSEMTQQEWVDFFSSRTDS